MEDPSICSPSPLPNSADFEDWFLTNNFSSSKLVDGTSSLFSFSTEESEVNNLSKTIMLFNDSFSSLSSSSNTTRKIPAAIIIPTGIILYVLSLLTFVGNAMVLHAIRTDKRLQTVSYHALCPPLLEHNVFYQSIFGLFFHPLILFL